MGQGKNGAFGELSCDEEYKESCKKCRHCFVSTKVSIYSRECFMTGEHCSKQSRIQRERKKLHEKNYITAFVVMNFSDMSDVVYKWRLQNFVESLTKYLYIDKDKNRLYCSAIENDKHMPEESRIKKIQVVRSDSDPASNYVVCSRICQQMQIADLIIVDVSSQNANVFYEFGMAVALGKMILPICYSESFFRMSVPKKMKDDYWKWKDEERDRLECHIGFYPWRKDLFEYYGIRYKYDPPKSKYIDFQEATKEEYGFSDIQYNRFPYHEIIDKEKNEGNKKIGQVIYEKLSKSYNDAKEEHNTLVVYTMDAFLNEGQAGTCIVNFYHDITARMRQEKCFCGERVGVLVQSNVIPESEKDSKEQLDLFYSVGEIVQIGLNQATYLSAEEKIKSNDDFTDWALPESEDEKAPTERQKDDIRRFVKGYVRNRGMRIYPNNPVFVDRMKTLLHKDILKSEEPTDRQVCGCCDYSSFCLYHVMVRTLRYTNEIVVDISNNCLQSLFWLGAAHASDIYAITVMHEKTDKERQQISERKVENRYVFDVAGLWMAILRKNDTEGFYEQLAAAQNGIERHSKLMLPDSGPYKEQLKEFLFSFDVSAGECDEKIDPDFIRSEKEKEEKEVLESYYRNHFWTPMLSYNQLSIYISQINELDMENEPRSRTASRDFEAISVLSHYLSKRKVIGEYHLKAQPEKKGAEDGNFISVGSSTKSDLPEYIYEQIKNEPEFCVIHEKKEYESKLSCNEENGKLIFKGFVRLGETEKIMLTQHPAIKYCSKCIKSNNCKGSAEFSIIDSEQKIEKASCILSGKSTHYEIAQLILWREDPKNLHGHSYFWVGIIGCSGPATYALSTIFVDREQREACFGEDKASDESGDNNLLCRLQSDIRRKFTEVFSLNLQKELNTISFKDKENKKLKEGQKGRYINLVKYAIASYLRTVLYRYFFPFLSEEEIERIHNGMYTFVNTMKAGKMSPFAVDYPSNEDQDFPSSVSNKNIEEIVQKIPEVLLSTLKSFKGLEAFYKVEVQHNLKGELEKDTRRAKKIEMIDESDANINYFFISR